MIKSAGSDEELNQFFNNQSKELLVCYFWASFHEACKSGGQIDQILNLLSERYDNSIEFVKVDAEEVSNVAETLGVTMVPSFVFIGKGKRKVEVVEGSNPSTLQNAIEKNLSTLSAKSDKFQKKLDEDEITVDKNTSERLRKLTTSSHVILFMKGNAAEPKCKFSRAMVELLNSHGIRFASFDILSDPMIRESLKDFSNWQTYPQLYIAGKFIGGLDTIKALVEKDNGDSLKAIILNDLAEPRAAVAAASSSALLNSANPPSPVHVNDKYLAGLVQKSQVMLFMKGDPNEPRCGFSSKMCTLLQKHKIKFSSFDILQNEDVRAKLKEFAKWPTYPQLWVNGSLVGGIDILEEMAEDEDESLADQLGLNSYEPRLAALVKQFPIMLFMKGTPDEPQCGFSREIVRILNEEKVEFDFFNILDDNEVRQGLKEFSKWPTFPQLYVSGKFVGGLDIIKELKEEDELKEALTV